MSETVLELSMPDRATLEYAISYYRPRFTVTMRSDDGAVCDGPTGSDSVTCF